MASPTQWTWVWASSGSWWWTGKPGVLQSICGCKEQDTTERLNWIMSHIEHLFTCFKKQTQKEKPCELKWPSDTGCFKDSFSEFFSDYLPQDILQGGWSLQPGRCLLKYDVSLRPHLYSCSYRKCLQGGSTFSFPTEIPRSTGALDTVVFKGCRFFWNVPHLGAHCFSPLRLHSLPKQIQSPAKTSRRGVLSYLGGGTLRKTVASGNCSTGSQGGQATFQGPSSSQGTRRGWAAGAHLEGPPGGRGAMHSGPSTPDPSGARLLAPPPVPSAPPHSSLRLQSPSGSRDVTPLQVTRLRAIPLAFLFCSF